MAELDKFFGALRKHGGSDLHVSSGSTPSIRLHGSMMQLKVEGVTRFRCNAFQGRQDPGAVFRIIPNDVMTAEQPGLPEAIRNFCPLSKGLVLVTGPPGL